MIEFLTTRVFVYSLAYVGWFIKRISLVHHPSRFLIDGLHWAGEVSGLLEVEKKKFRVSFIFFMVWSLLTHIIPPDFGLIVWITYVRIN